ncbi:universal stress protein [Streptomyces albireticuli]|uniref:universal stress protein n=1 Tax=Streptomyces albireticuli TaxID=1940 RepID=UPI0014765E49|nr:universal stress protein [Streptomyces albireticuli]MCD9143341.1 universal stress protein [Streptomyces albireticuli]MCD9163783.1 universal stress protein [Streptomyces albireticuli]MCD9191458.1 universal stress protein [Streptomyces albireticuli]
MSHASGRVIVGVSGSLGSLAALRRAVEEARRDGRTLVAVIAWAPPEGETLYRRAPCPPLAKAWAGKAADRLDTAFHEALGGVPEDVDVEFEVVRAAPGFALCDIADRAGDLLVVGAGGQGLAGRLRWGPVRRYVLAKARCPVLAVPAPAVSWRTARAALRRVDPMDFTPRRADPHGTTA